MYTIYGIPNCDTTKKALTCFKTNKITFTFHNYKTQNIGSSILKRWCKQKRWESILNKKSTTWRALGADVQSTIINEKSAIKIMLQHTSLIKRPIIELAENVVAIGFDEAIYEKLFNIL